jgi:hypothetical protein
VIWAVRGLGKVSAYFSKRYNIVRRFIRNEEKCDEEDCFMLLLSSSSEEGAKRRFKQLCKEFSNVEFVEFKKPQQESE